MSSSARVYAAAANNKASKASAVLSRTAVTLTLGQSVATLAGGNTSVQTQPDVTESNCDSRGSSTQKTKIRSKNPSSASGVEEVERMGCGTIRPVHVKGLLLLVDRLPQPLRAKLRPLVPEFVKVMEHMAPLPETRKLSELAGICWKSAQALLKKAPANSRRNVLANLQQLANSAGSPNQQDAAVDWELLDSIDSTFRPAVRNFMKQGPKLVHGMAMEMQAYLGQHPETVQALNSAVSVFTNLLSLESCPLPAAFYKRLLDGHNSSIPSTGSPSAARKTASVSRGSNTTSSSTAGAASQSGAFQQTGNSQCASNMYGSQVPWMTPGATTIASRG